MKSSGSRLTRSSSSRMMFSLVSSNGDAAGVETAWREAGAAHQPPHAPSASAASPSAVKRNTLIPRRRVITSRPSLKEVKECAARYPITLPLHFARPGRKVVRIAAGHITAVWRRKPEDSGGATRLAEPSKKFQKIWTNYRNGRILPANNLPEVSDRGIDHLPSYPGEGGDFFPDTARNPSLHNRR